MDTPTTDDTQTLEKSMCSMSEKLKSAYIIERSRLEATEVELSRSSIMMIDENGQLVKVNIMSEH